jgi:protein MPE1
MPVNAKNSSRKEASGTKASVKPSNTSGTFKIDSAMTEEERMAAMFQAQSEQWSAQQDEMAK